MNDFQLWKLAIDGGLILSLLYLCYLVWRSPVAAQSRQIEQLESSLKALIKEAELSGSALNDQLMRRQQSLERLLNEATQVDSRIQHSIQHSGIQHSGIQHSGIQHSIVATPVGGTSEHLTEDYVTAASYTASSQANTMQNAQPQMTAAAARRGGARAYRQSEELNQRMRAPATNDLLAPSKASAAKPPQPSPRTAQPVAAPKVQASASAKLNIYGEPISGESHEDFQADFQDDIYTQTEAEDEAYVFETPSAQRPEPRVQKVAKNEPARDSSAPAYRSLAASVEREVDSMSSQKPSAQKPIADSSIKRLEKIYESAEEMLKAGKNLETVAAQTSLPIDDVRRLSQMIIQEQFAQEARRASESPEATPTAGSDSRLGVLGGMKRQVQTV